MPERRTLNRTYSVGDQVPTCPVFTRAKIKSRFGILVDFSSQYLPMICKILTTIKEEIYKSLLSHRFFPEEQTGCLKWTRGTLDILYIYQHIYKDIKIKRKIRPMTWTDYRKAYNMLDNRQSQTLQDIR